MCLPTSSFSNSINNLEIHKFNNIRLLPRPYTDFSLFNMRDPKYIYGKMIHNWTLIKHLFIHIYITVNIL